MIFCVTYKRLLRISIYFSALDVGTLIDAEKYIDTSYTAIYIRAENHFAKVNGGTDNKNYEHI